jgi:hypothetical protein
MFGGNTIYVICGLLAVAYFVCVVWGAKKARKDYREFLDEHEEEIYPTSFPTVAERMTVVDCYCYVETVGMKHSKAMKNFVVEFASDDDRRLKLPVSEEMYDGFEIGQCGILTTVEGELFSFDLQ